MPKIDELWDTHIGETIYIVGTGPSSQVFPFDFLQDKTVILLKQAWRFFKPQKENQYLLTVHPERLPENYKQWKFITKRRKAIKEHININYGYEFKANYECDLPIDNYKLLVKRRSGCLYQGRGAQTTGICLAAHMGASTVVLVGCDMCQLGPHHHGIEQETKFHGLDPEEVYDEYYRNSVDVRRLVKNHFGLTVLSLSPFLSETRAEQDYKQLKEDMSFPELAVVADISKYNRLKNSLYE